MPRFLDPPALRRVPKASSSNGLDRPFFGWWVVAAAFLIAVFGWGFGFYGPTIYLYAVIERTGWSVTLVSSAVTLHFLVGAAVVTTLPRLYDAFGLPVVTLAGSVLLAIGVLGWAAVAEPWQLFAAALASGIGWVALGAAAVNAMVAPWFVRARPAALGMAYNGASVGGVIFSPLWVALIASFGFSAAAAGAGILMIAIVAVLALGSSRRPRRAWASHRMGMRPGWFARASPRPSRPRCQALPCGATGAS